MLKTASCRSAQQEHTDRVRMIGVLQRTIADAERRRGASMCAAVVAERNRIIFDAKAKLAELAGI